MSDRLPSRSTSSEDSPTPTGSIRTDLVLSMFGAEMGNVLDAARAADVAGFDGVWVFDHFSASNFGAGWSRDPFVALGAIAAVTKRVRLGVLVANMTNRHPAQLALGINSLQALAPGRVVCGLGAGASPGTKFASEQTSIGRELGAGPQRRAQLAETIQALRAIWAGHDFIGEHVTVDGLRDVIDPSPIPPIIVGASGPKTVAVAAEHAEGVNIRNGPGLDEAVAHARAAGNPDLEISVFDDFERSDPLGGDPQPFIDMGITRRTLSIRPPYSIAAIEAIGKNLQDTFAADDG